ncbi:hypothetical protein CU098_011431 [Rhizopus stolonifer]|uniref:Uncharacterized protein n=1 Tax=Rhizopus stolonifer TaxID=4846 RepID=A0A367KEE1_RHIST|nr:hypothetical protein CU098_011431 [Rhizopus stolonifer]
MQRSLEGLTKITEQLNIKTTLEQQPPALLDLKPLEQEKLSLEMELKKNKELLEQERDRQQRLEKEKEALARKLEVSEAKQRQDNKWQQQIKQLEQQYAQLTEKNQSLVATIEQLEEHAQKEVQRKEQHELLLRENAEELKATTEGILERDQKIEELQENLKYVQQILEEKDELLEKCVTKAQLDSEQYDRLQDRLEQLEAENIELKQRLKKNIASPIEQEETEGMEQLKQELATCQQQLLQKTSQNKELESAMERANDHYTTK